jgi:hypothetical protein
MRGGGQILTEGMQNLIFTDLKRAFGKGNRIKLFEMLAASFV